MSEDRRRSSRRSTGRGGSTLLDAVRDVHVVVLGDVMLDHFMVGRVSRISPEAPVPIVEFEREFSVPGGAANVAHNARALGARVTLIGLVGDDAAAADLRGLLEARGIAATGLVVDPARPTTRKMRLVTTRNQQVARVDVERAADAQGALDDALAAAVEEAAASAAAIIVSDYLKGVVTQRVMAHAIAAAHRARRARARRSQGAAPGALCRRHAAHAQSPRGRAGHRRPDPDGRRRAPRRPRPWREQARVEGVLVTWGERGMWLSHQASEGHLPAAAREVADVTGAGDTVVAHARRGHGGRRDARPRPRASPTRRLASSSRASARPRSAPTTSRATRSG